MLVGLVGVLAVALLDLSARMMSGVRDEVHTEVTAIRGELSTHAAQDLDVARELRQSLESLRREVLEAVRR